MDDAAKEKVQKKIDALKEALKESDLEKIKTEKEALQQELYAISEILYKAAGDQQPSGEAPGAESGPIQAEAKSEDNVVEADYEVVDDKEKKEDDKGKGKDKKDK